MSHELVLGIYQITNAFPHTEMFGITNQLRRASSSVPANVVEGQSRKTTKEYLQFLYNARGSLEETRYLLILAKDLNYIDKKVYESCEMDCESISKMLNGLIKSLKKK